jgi:hypothetical protein
MADLLTDQRRPWAVDDQRFEEITLLTDVMIEATSHSGPLTQVEIDVLLARAPGVARPVPPDRHPVPHPRREEAMSAR